MADESPGTAVAGATGLPARTAEWAAFAALHAGVFTRTQVRDWLDRPTADANRTEAARIASRLCELDLATEEKLAGIGRFVHIHAKQVYRALGEPENRNRRKPAREKAIERLLCLDYVLDHPDEAWLPTERAKTEACTAAGIAPAAWPSKLYPAKDGVDETTRYFVEKFPMAIDPPRGRAVVTCVSTGTTTARVRSWLGSYGPLIRSLGRAGCAIQLVHIAPRAALSDAAAKELAKAAARFGGADEDAETIRQIKSAILAETEEALDSIGGLTLGLETAGEIYSRRGNDIASDPIEVETQAWTSTRVATPEDTP